MFLVRGLSITLQNAVNLLRLQILMERLVYHQRRRVVASAEAGDGQHSELAVRAGLAKLNPQARGQMLAYPFIAHNPATDAVADEDHSLAHRLAEDQVVKGRHAVQLVGRHLKNLGQVADVFVRHPATAPWNDLQRITTQAALLRVLMEFRFYLVSFFFSQHGCAQGVGKRNEKIRSPLPIPHSPLPLLAIYISQYKIYAAQDRQQIGDHRAATDQRDHLHMGERRGADADAIGHRIAVADQVITIVALGRLDVNQRFTRRDHRPPAHTQKVSDQRLDVLHRAFFDRRRRQRVVRFIRPGGHVAQTLLDDPQALAHLGHADDGAVIAISAFGGGDVELELIVAGVGALLSEVPLESACAQARAGHAPLDGLVQRVGADADCARLEDAVLHDHLVVLVQPAPHVRDEIADQPVPTPGQVLGDAADPGPARVHASATDGLDDIEDALAVGEHVEHGRERPEVLRECAVPDQVAGQSKELSHHDADHLHAVGDFDPGELLDRQYVSGGVHHPAEVIHAVGVRDVGVPRLALAHLFGAPVVEAYVRHDVEDLLAAELQHEAQHAVSAGVLRPQVEEHKIGVLAASIESPVF